MDMIKYSWLWPRYIADMHELKVTNQDTWKEIEEGKIPVTKNDISFVSIGQMCLWASEQTHEGSLWPYWNLQESRCTTLLLLGSSRTFQLGEGIHFSVQLNSHHLQSSQIIASWQSICCWRPSTAQLDDPRYILDEYVSQILNMDDMGQKLLEICWWAHKWKCQSLGTHESIKKHAVKVRDNITDIKETKDLYGRLTVLAKSNRNVIQKDAMQLETMSLPRLPEHSSHQSTKCCTISLCQSICSLANCNFFSICHFCNSGTLQGLLADSLASHRCLLIVTVLTGKSLPFWLLFNPFEW